MPFLGKPGTASASARRQREKTKKEIDEKAHAAARLFVETHPPRVELPIELGHWSEDKMAPTYDVDFFGMRKVEDRYGKRWRPTGPIVRVPIMDQAWRFGSLPRPQSYAYMQQDILMRPVSWTVRMNDTHVRWYNWEPVHQMGCFGDAEADIYSAVGKMLVYMDRFRMAFHYMPLDSSSIFGGAFTLREFIVWFAELEAAMQEWRGKIRAFYVVPGKKPGDPPEERAR